MSPLGKKLRHTVHILGRKVKQGEKMGQKIGRHLSVDGRKLSNTAHMLGSQLNKVDSYVSGTPLQGALSVARDVVKLGEVAGKGIRKGGKGIEKMSHASKLSEEVNHFI